MQLHMGPHLSRMLWAFPRAFLAFVLLRATAFLDRLRLAEPAFLMNITAFISTQNLINADAARASSPNGRAHSAI